MIIDIPNIVLTGTATNGWDGRTQSISLNFNPAPFEITLTGIVQRVFDGFEWLFEEIKFLLIEYDQAMPWILICLALIAIFTIIKREVRL